MQSMLDGGSIMRMIPDELKLKSAVRAGWPGTRQPARWFVERGRSFFPELFKVSVDGRTVVVCPDSTFGGLSRIQLEEILDLDRYAAGLSKLLENDPTEMEDILRRDADIFVSSLREGGESDPLGIKGSGWEFSGDSCAFPKVLP